MRWSQRPRFFCSTIRYTRKQLTRGDVAHSFAGVRPLLEDDAENPSAVTRDYVLDLDAANGKAPILHIFGGKITIYRELAERGLDRLKPYYRQMTGSWTGKVPLPGGDMPDADFEAFEADLARHWPWKPADLSHHYARLYGTRAARIVGSSESFADLGRHFGGLFYQVEADYLIAEEWAATADDILTRRTKHGLKLSAAETESFRQWMSERVGALGP